MKDDTMSVILHIHDTILPGPQKCLTDKLKLKILSPVTVRDKLRMNKQTCGGSGWYAMFLMEDGITVK